MAQSEQGLSFALLVQCLVVRIGLPASWVVSSGSFLVILPRTLLIQKCSGFCLEVCTVFIGSSAPAKSYTRPDSMYCHRNIWSIRTSKMVSVISDATFEAKPPYWLHGMASVNTWHKCSSTLRDMHCPWASAALHSLIILDCDHRHSKVSTVS